jgi:hypothetical protein
VTSPWFRFRRTCSLSLETKTARFDASKFHDRHEAVIVVMINEKKAGLPVSTQRELPRIVAGTDLMAPLRQSIEKAKEAGWKPTTALKPAPATKPVELAKAATAAPKAKKAAKRNPHQREVPIAGGGPPKEATEKQPQKSGVRKKVG